MKTEWIGHIAGFLTTIAYLPQVWRVWRTQSVKDISANTYIALALGVFLWIVYGIIEKKAPIYFFNSIALLLILFVLYMKITLEKQLPK